VFQKETEVGVEKELIEVEVVAQLLKLEVKAGIEADS